MSAVNALLRDLETTMARGSEGERVQMLRRLTDLFLSGANVLGDEQVNIFDMVIGRLSRAIETSARIELAERLSDAAKAPHGLLRQLALDDLSVARPVLTRSPRLTDQDLVAVAAAKGRDHMLAISARPHLGEPVTDFLILRGGRVVTQAVAANLTARFSRHGMGVLVMRAVQDEALQATLGARHDIPQPLAEQLVLAAKNSARMRLSAGQQPALHGAIDRAIERSADAVHAGEKLRDDLGAVSAAVAEIAGLQASHALDENRLALYASDRATEHVIAAIAAMAGLSLPSAEQVLLGNDRDAVLLVARGLGWSWETTRLLVLLRTDLGRSDAAVARARQHFASLATATAQRVLGFLRARDAAP